LLKVPGIEFGNILPFLDESLKDISGELIERIAVSIKYEGYIKKQTREVEKFKRMESESIPKDFDYHNLTGFRNEAKEKFIKFRPMSLGQAGRIEGITIGDLSALSIHLKKYQLSSKRK
ncbi:MAG: tRNA uridine-5-carboxymethylaminomethyl(34) synthesis enzyme MnmG, partial [Candidatus Zixiibacteriota bacterium]